MIKQMKVTARTVLREYNAGYDSGLNQKAALQSEATTSNMLVLIQENMNSKMPIGIKSDYPLVRAYWQGYYDAMQGWHRNAVYTKDSKPPWPKDNSPFSDTQEHHESFA